MFYLFFSLAFVIILSTYLVLKLVVFKNNEKFNNVINKLLKIFAVALCSVMLISIILPDAFVLSRDSAFLGNGIYRGYAILRWFGMVSFIAIPIAVFTKNRHYKNIAVYFCTVVAIVSLFFYSRFLSDFISTEGKGLNSISALSINFKNFLINPTFRSIIWGFTILLQIIIPVILAIQEKHMFNFKDKNEYKNFFIILPLSILSIIPIYVPQYLFGHTNILFKAYSIPHLIWLVLVVVEFVALYFIFRKKDYDSKFILLLVMSLSLLMQYSQMFGAISINIKRLPLQLCNLGAYFILISLLTKNKKIFDFTVIINVVGVTLALLIPDLDGKGLFYLYNMHFVLEHTNVLIVPILALLFNIFPRVDIKSLKHALIGFTIYFASVFVIGTAFNAIKVATGNDFWEANYLFMFIPEVALDLLPFLKPVFDIKLTLGAFTFYPVLQLIVYLFLTTLCIAMYYGIRLIYKIKDKIQSKKLQPAENQE